MEHKQGKARPARRRRASGLHAMSPCNQLLPLCRRAPTQENKRPPNPTLFSCGGVKGNGATTRQGWGI
ncbi:hypothetical protein GQ55_6G019300 [Panicum hallii var. hallii]|uniref:Uncharacterized protein n=2 Tax=Panicum hallii TaxID=206008 RepID=A0A2T7D2V1_9POAL|nr:hypothetical protein GQ55_6G019300 [Panicum hallii var. hallii]PUZ49936.1 hypothetical protein GQ55_6G019300 [Panicum hallii var. hallii]